MRTSSSGVQTPPGISGTTEKVPSFWMLAWTRSLMKRASRSSSYSPFHTVISSDASAGFAPASTSPLPSSRKTEDTDLSPRATTSLTSSGFRSGMVGM